MIKVYCISNNTNIPVNIGCVSKTIIWPRDCLYKWLY